MVLDKKETLFDRDENGELIPQEVELVIDEEDENQMKYKGETVMVTPITRGELKRLFSSLPKEDEDEDIDAKVIVEHCRNPSFTEKEAKHIKPAFSSMLVNTIFDMSGLENKKNKSRRENFNKAEDEFAKN